MDQEAADQAVLRRPFGIVAAAGTVAVAKEDVRVAPPRVADVRVVDLDR